MQRTLEALTFFLAMRLAIILEGGFVFWMFRHPPEHANSDSSLNVVGGWTGLGLPRCWWLGLLLVLTSRVTAMCIPPLGWPDREFRHNRRAFLSHLCLAIALVAMRGLALFLGHVVVRS